MNTSENVQSVMPLKEGRCNIQKQLTSVKHIACSAKTYYLFITVAQQLTEYSIFFLFVDSRNNFVTCEE